MQKTLDFIQMSLPSDLVTFYLYKFAQSFLQAMVKDLEKNIDFTSQARCAIDLKTSGIFNN